MPCRCCSRVSRSPLRQRQARKLAPTSEDARGQGAPGGEAGAVPLVQRGILILRGCKTRQYVDSSGLAGGLWSSRSDCRADQCMPAGSADSAASKGADSADPRAEWERRSSPGNRSAAPQCQCMLQHRLAASPPHLDPLPVEQVILRLLHGCNRRKVKRQRAHIVTFPAQAAIAPAACACSGSPETGEQQTQHIGWQHERKCSQRCRWRLLPAAGKQAHLGLRG